MFGLRTVPIGAKADEALQARKDGHESVWEDFTTDLHTPRRKGARQKRERVES